MHLFSEYSNENWNENITTEATVCQKDNGSPLNLYIFQISFYTKMIVNLSKSYIFLHVYVGILNYNIVVYGVTWTIWQTSNMSIWIYVFKYHLKPLNHLELLL